MYVFTFGKYRLDIDVGRTRLFYNRAERITDGCSCDNCRNYELATEFFPSEVHEFFSEIGVDIKKAAEIYTSDDNGKIVDYNGFYHICAQMLSDTNCWVPIEKIKDNGLSAFDENNLYLITEGFSVGFTNECHLLEENFPLPVIQMEISFRCPWVLEWLSK